MKNMFSSTKNNGQGYSKMISVKYNHFELTPCKAEAAPDEEEEEEENGLKPTFQAIEVTL
jgi:hypothetical protein